MTDHLDFIITAWLTVARIGFVTAGIAAAALLVGSVIAVTFSSRGRLP